MAHTEVSVTELTYAGRTIGSAIVKTYEKGQVDPDTSDQVEVVVELELPASPTGAQTLHEELQFGSLVNVFGGDLEHNWSQVTGKVARQQTYTGTVYATLFSTAQGYAATELAKLTTALSTRDAALTAAG